MTESTGRNAAAGEKRPSAPEMRRKRRVTSLVAVLSGNFLEWFDWTIYAIFTPYIAANFFNSNDPASAVLATLVVFAVGFAARPLGGLVLGRVGDRLGRRFALILAMTLLATGSLLIGVMPTYESVGIWASVLLVIARVIQGLAHGGESGNAYTYLAEIAPARRRGLWGSFNMVSVMIAVMAATALGAGLTSVVDEASMNSWGWRVPFILGASLAVVALYIRRSASESEQFQEVQKERAKKTLRPLSRRQLTIIAVRIVMLSLLTQVLYYTWVSFFAAFAISSQGMDPNGAYLASFGAQVIALVALPLWGKFSDRVGRRRTYTYWALAVIVAVFPISWILTDSPWTLLVAQTIALVIWAMQASIHSTIMAEQSPTATRATSVGIWSSVGAALTGGTAPYLNTWLASMGLSWVFSIYVIVLAVATLVTVRFMPETSRLEMDDIPVPGATRANPAWSASDH